MGNFPFFRPLAQRAFEQHATTPDAIKRETKMLGRVLLPMRIDASGEYFHIPRRGNRQMGPIVRNTSGRYVSP